MVQIQKNFTDRTSSSCRCSMTWNGQGKMFEEIARCRAGAIVQIANRFPLEHGCFCGPIQERTCCTLDRGSNGMWDEVTCRRADIFALQTPRLVLACNAPRSNRELLTKGSGHQIHSQVTPPNVFMLKWTIQEGNSLCVYNVECAWHIKN